MCGGGGVMSVVGCEPCVWWRGGHECGWVCVCGGGGS